MPANKGKSINAVVAENLAYWIEKAGFTSQTALAEKAGVSQKTVSNYLNPEQRLNGGEGKERSAKLTELASIAAALGVEVHQLTRPMTASERQFYEALERAYLDLRESARAAHTQAEAGESELQEQREATAKRVAAKENKSQKRTRKTGK